MCWMTANPKSPHNSTTLWLRHPTPARSPRPYVSSTCREVRFHKGGPDRMNFELALYKGELECQLTLTSMIHNLSHFYFPIYPCSGSVLKTQPLFLRFQPRVANWTFLIRFPATSETPTLFWRHSCSLALSFPATSASEGVTAMTRYTSSPARRNVHMCSR